MKSALTLGFMALLYSFEAISAAPSAIHHWQLDNEGTTLTDVGTTGGYDMSAGANVPTGQNNRYGYTNSATEFTRTTNNNHYETAGKLPNASQLTIDFWIRTNDYTAGDAYTGYIFQQDLVGNNSGDFSVAIYQDNIWVHREDGSAATCSSTGNNWVVGGGSAIQVNDNKWHHVAVTVNTTGETRIYIDGILDASETCTDTTTAPLFASAATAKIGDPNTGSHFGGELDEIRIWDAALLPADIVNQAYRVKRWDGGAGDDKWSSATNWAPDGVPFAGHDIILDETYITTGNYVVNMLTDRDIGSLRIENSPGQSIRLETNGNILNIEKPVTTSADSMIKGGGIMNFTATEGTNRLFLPEAGMGGLLDVTFRFNYASTATYLMKNGPIELNGNLLLYDGELTIGDLAVTGDVDMITGFGLGAGSAKTLSLIGTGSRTANLSGSFSGPVVLEVNNGVGDQYEITSTTTNLTGPLLKNGAGTLVANNTLTASQCDFNGTGSVDIRGATMTCTNGFTVAGSVVNAGSAANVTAQSLTMSSGTLYTDDSIFNVTRGNLDLSGGTVGNVNAATTYNMNASDSNSYTINTGTNQIGTLNINHSDPAQQYELLSNLNMLGDLNINDGTLNTNATNNYSIDAASLTIGDGDANAATLKSQASTITLTGNLINNTTDGVHATGDALFKLTGSGNLAGFTGTNYISRLEAAYAGMTTTLNGPVSEVNVVRDLTTNPDGGSDGTINGTATLQLEDIDGSASNSPLTVVNPTVFTVKNLVLNYKDTTNLNTGIIPAGLNHTANTSHFIVLATDATHVTLDSDLYTDGLLVVGGAGAGTNAMVVLNDYSFTANDLQLGYSTGDFAIAPHNAGGELFEYNAPAVTHTVNGDVTLKNGSTLDLTDDNLTVAGNWAVDGTSSFNAGSSTVTLNGSTAQTITGNNTFNNLTLADSGARTVTFPAGGTQTVNGTFTAPATAGQVINLRSSTAGTRTTVTVNGTIGAIDYVDVQDHDINGSAWSANINPANGTNSGNNLNWFDELVGHWPLDGNFTDSVSSTTGTASGSPVSSQNRHAVNDTAYTFNGVDDIINTGVHLPKINASTISAWFKTTATHQNAIVSQDVSGSNDLDTILTIGDANTCNTATAGTLTLEVHGNSFTNCLYTSLVVNDGRWHHVAAIVSGTTYTIYVDGKLVNSEAGKSQAGIWGSDGSSDVQIGFAQYGASHMYFNGQIDEVKVFNYGRSAAQVLQDYNTKKWDGGGGDNNWNNAANWVPDGVPAAGDDVILDNSYITGSTYTVNLPAAATTVGNLEVAGANAPTLNLNSQTLTVNHHLDFTGGSISTGQISLNGTTDGPFNLKRDTANGSFNSVNIAVNTTGRYNLDTAGTTETFDGSLAVNSGTFSTSPDMGTSSNNLTINDDLTVNGGTLTVYDSTLTINDDMGFVSGAFTKNAGQTTRVTGSADGNSEITGTWAGGNKAAVIELGSAGNQVAVNGTLYAGDQVIFANSATVSGTNGISVYHFGSEARAIPIINNGATLSFNELIYYNSQSSVDKTLTGGTSGNFGSVDLTLNGSGTMVTELSTDFITTGDISIVKGLDMKAFDISAGSITINKGTREGSLGSTVAGSILTLTGDLNVYDGTLGLANIGTVSVGGNLTVGDTDADAATFNSASATVTVSGDLTLDKTDGSTHTSTAAIFQADGTGTITGFGQSDGFKFLRAGYAGQTTTIGTGAEFIYTERLQTNFNGGSDGTITGPGTLQVEDVDGSGSTTPLVVTNPTVFTVNNILVQYADVTNPNTGTVAAGLDHASNTSNLIILTTDGEYATLAGNINTSGGIGIGGRTSLSTGEIQTADFTMTAGSLQIGYLNGDFGVAPHDAYGKLTETGATTGQVHTVNGDVTIHNSSTLTMVDDELHIRGSYDNSLGGSFVKGSGSVYFDATTTGHTIATGGDTFYRAYFSGTGGGYTLADNFQSTFNYISDGTLNTSTFDLTGSTFQMSGGILNNGASGSINATGGNFSFTAGTINAGTKSFNISYAADFTGTFNADSSTVNLNGTVTGTSNNYAFNTGGNTFNNLTLGGTETTAATDLYLQNGVLNVSGNLTINNNKLDTQNNNVNITGDLSIGDGTNTNAGSATLTAGTSTIALGGSLSMNATDGAFNAASATLNLNGAAASTQTIGSAITVANLTLSDTGARTITFPASTTSTVSTALNAMATTGNVITIDSSDGTNAFTLDGSGTATATGDYLNVSNSTLANFTGSPPLNTTTSTDGGNTTDWFSFFNITARETIDNDGNGFIDRIRFTTSANLNDNFGDIAVTVTGFTVTAVNTGATANDDIFEVSLNEILDPSVGGSGITPTTQITANTLLQDSTNTDTLGTDGATVSTTDNAAPVLLWGRAATGDTGYFLEFSEAVYTNTGSTGNLVTTDFNYSDNNTAGAASVASFADADGSDNNIDLNFNTAAIAGDMGTDIIAPVANQIYDAADNPALTNSVTIDNGIYVHATNGNDSNAGLIGAEKQTIGAALTTAVSGNEIRVAGGTYNVTYGTDHIILKENVDVLGGYDPANWSTARDATTYTTTITDTIAAGGTATAPNRAVEAGAGITSATTFDGFTVNGGGGDHSAGVFISGGSTLNLTNNRLNGGSGATESSAVFITDTGTNPAITANRLLDGGTGNLSYAIHITADARAQILNNTDIRGGNGATTGFSYGIFSESTDATGSLISGNTIDAGTGPGARGIYMRGGAIATIDASSAANTINGGSGATSSYGIFLYDAGTTATISGNEISGGSAANSAAIWVDNGADATITSNTAGSGLTGGSGTGGSDSAGIDISGGSSAIISGNTINGGSQPISYGIKISDASSVTVDDSTAANTINGGSGATWSYGVHINGTGTNPTISNNTINGGSGGDSHAVRIEADADPTVSGNTIQGGTASAYSYALKITDAGTAPIIDNNNIDGGTGASSSYGVRVELDADPTVSNNTIGGGNSATSSFGMRISDAGTDPPITGNTINGGTSDIAAAVRIEDSANPGITGNTINGEGDGAGTASYGIRMNALSTATISDNTINGGTQATSRAIYIYSGAYATIDASTAANTIDGGSGSTASYGIVLEDASATATTISGNTINGGSSSTESVGIHVESGATPTISANSINGGTGGGTAIAAKGIYVTGAGTNANISNNTLISGGSPANGSSAAIEVTTSATATIQNNTEINGGSATAVSKDATGIRIFNGATATINGNYINAGTSNNWTFGIVTTGAGSDSTVSGNRIFGGAGTNISLGLSYESSATGTVYNNLIHGGTSGTDTRGIQAKTAVNYYHNTIYAGSATDSAGVFAVNLGGSGDFANNIIFCNGAGYGFKEFNASSDPASFQNNNIFNCTTGLYHNEDTTAITTDTGLNALADATISGNISMDMLAANYFTDHDGADNDINTITDNNWDVVDTGVHANLLQGGLDLTATVTDDFGAVARTATVTDSPTNTGAAGVTLGAYEDDNAALAITALYSKASGDFSTAANWYTDSCGGSSTSVVPPDGTINITICDTTTMTLSAADAAGDLTVLGTLETSDDGGTSVYDLTVNGNLTIGDNGTDDTGSLVSYTAAVTVAGDVTIDNTTTASTLTTTGGLWDINGSWANNGTQTISGSSMSFTGTGTIQSGGSDFNTVLINSAGGTYTLLDDMNTSGNFEVIDGTLNTDATNNYALDVGGNLSIGDGSGAVSTAVVEANNSAMTVSGNWSRNQTDGEYRRDTGQTVTLNGTATVTGMTGATGSTINNFYNLNAGYASEVTTFDVTAVDQYIGNQLVLHGGEVNINGNNQPVTGPEVTGRLVIFNDVNSGGVVNIDFNGSGGAASSTITGNTLYIDTDTNTPDMAGGSATNFAMNTLLIDHSPPGLGNLILNNNINTAADVILYGNGTTGNFDLNGFNLTAGHVNIGWDEASNATWEGSVRNTDIATASTITAANLKIENSSTIDASGVRPVNLSVAGNITNNGTFSAGDSNITHTGTGTITGFNATNYMNNLTVAAAAQTTTLSGSIYARGTVSVADGILNGDGGGDDELVLSDPNGSATTPVFNITGSPTLQFSNKIVFELDDAAYSIPGFNYGDSDVIVRSTGATAFTHTLAGNLTTGGTLRVYAQTAGGEPTLQTNDATINAVQMAAGFSTAEGGTIEETGAGANTHTVTSSVIIDHANAALTLIDDTLNVGADFNTGSGGTFNAGTSTVTLNGTGAQNIYGTVTFNNLTLADSGARNIILPQGLTTTVNGAFTANATAGNVISLDSSDATNRFTLDLRGSTGALSYLNVSNSQASSSNSAVTLPLIPTNSTDGGNTDAWFPVNILYSLTTGAWGLSTTWSTDACGGIQGITVLTPDANYDTVICDGDTVTLGVGNTAKSVTVGNGASGELNFNGRTLNVITNFTANAGSTLSGQAGAKVNFLGTNNATADAYTIQTSAQSLPETEFNNIETGASTDTWQLNDNSSINVLTLTKGNLNLNNFNLNTSSYTQTGGVFTATAATITNALNFSITGGTFNADTSTLTLTGDGGGGATSYSLQTSGHSLNNLNLNSTDTGASADTYTISDALTLSGSLNINEGTLDTNAANYALSVTGDLTIGDGAGAAALAANTSDLTVSGSIDRNTTDGTFTINNGQKTVLNGTGTVTGFSGNTAGTNAFWDLEAAFTGNTTTMSSANSQVVFNSLTTHDGTLAVGTNMLRLNNVAASTVTQPLIINSTTFTCGSGYIIYNSDNTRDYTVTGADYGNCNLEIKSFSRTATLNADLTTTGNISLRSTAASGGMSTFDLAGFNLTAGNLNVGVTAPQINPGTLIANNSTITLTGALTIPNTAAAAGSSVLNLTDATVNVDSVTLANEMYVNGATSITLPSTTANNIDMASADSFLDIADAATLTFTGHLNQSNGTLTLGAGTSGIIEFKGDYTKTGGTFTANAGSTVRITGTVDQKFDNTGGLTFVNLFINNASGAARAVRFKEAETYTVTGDFTATGGGTTTTRLGLYSNMAATATTFNLNGNITAATDYLSVRDIDLTGSTGTTDANGGAALALPYTVTVFSALGNNEDLGNSVGWFPVNTLYSIATGNWATATTWSPASCSGAAGGVTPDATLDVVICTGTTVTPAAAGETFNAKDLTVDGTLVLNNTTVNIAGNYVQTVATSAVTETGTTSTVSVTGNMNITDGNYAIGSTLSTTGTLAIAGAGTINIGGMSTANAQLDLHGTGTATLNGMTANAGADISHVAATISGTSTVTGAYNQTGGTLNIADGASLTVDDFNKTAGSLVIGPTGAATFTVNNTWSHTGGQTFATAGVDTINGNATLAQAVLYEDTVADDGGYTTILANDSTAYGYVFQATAADGNEVFMQITEPSANLDAAAVETITTGLTLALSGGDNENAPAVAALTLTETGVNTGIFRSAAFPTHLTTPGTADNGTLEGDRDEILTFSYTDPLNGADAPSTQTRISDSYAPAIASTITRDTDNDGKIDAIEITFDSAVNNDCSGLTINVTGYTTSGFSNCSGETDSTITVNLVENSGECSQVGQSGCDTGATPSVSIAANTTLTGTTNPGVVQPETASSTDGAPAALLAVKTTVNSTNAEVIFSENISRSGGGSFQTSDFIYSNNYVGGATAISAVSASASANTIGITLNNPFKVSDNNTDLISLNAGIFVDGSGNTSSGSINTIDLNPDEGAVISADSGRISDNFISFQEKSTARVGFNLTEPMSIKIELYDMKGRKIKTVHSASYPAGKNFYQWDVRASGVRSGFYFIHISADKWSQPVVQKMMIVR